MIIIIISFIISNINILYRGNWLDDKASGLGKLSYSNGDWYDGQWERDQRHGNILLIIFLHLLFSYYHH
jgi:hypothetical protein